MVGHGVGRSLLSLKGRALEDGHQGPGSSPVHPETRQPAWLHGVKVWVPDTQSMPELFLFTGGVGGKEEIRGGKCGEKLSAGTG